MMNPKKKYLIFLITVIIFNLALIPVVFVRSDDYDLSIDENTVIEWEVTTANEDELEQYFSYSTDYDESDFDYEEGDEIKVEISSITEYDDYYYVECKYYENSENQGYLYEKVAIDPADLAEDLAEDYGDSYSVVFICTDTKDYLAEFDENVPPAYSYFVYASGSALFINLTSSGYPYCIIVEYDEDGIQEKLSLLKDNLLIFEMELQDVSHLNPFATFLMIFIIVNIVVIILIAVIVTVVILSKRSKKKVSPKTQPTPQLTPTPAPQPYAIPKVSIPTQPTEFPKEKLETEEGEAKVEAKYCEHCGALKDKDDKFCPFCGVKY